MPMIFQLPRYLFLDVYKRQVCDIYMVYGKKQEPSILILIDLESLSRLSTEQLEKDIITMKSLILAQDER